MGRKDETLAEFALRVQERTGVALADIPVATTLDGHIVAHHFDTNTFVFYTGYPAWEDEDGTQNWIPEEAARQVVL